MSIPASDLWRYYPRLAALLLVVLLVTPVYAAQPPPLQMGVLPYLSSERLFEKFLPLKDYLEAQLKRRIVLSTAPDFKTYVQRATRGDYDIYFTAPHFALLAETEQSYRRVSRFTRDLDGLVVVRRDSAVQRPEDLRGRLVITPAALAITSILGEQLLREHGLMPGKDYRLARTISHDNAVLTVYRRAADAAIIYTSAFEDAPVEVKQGMRILTRTSQVPNTMFMAHARLPTAEYRRLKSALLAFTRDGPGQKFFESPGLGDMGAITNADMNRLRPFLRATQERLK